MPLFQNESECETFHMKMSFACSFILMQIKVIFRGTRKLGNGLLCIPPSPNAWYIVLGSKCSDVYCEKIAFISKMELIQLSLHFFILSPYHANKKFSVLKGPVTRATFSFNFSRNIVVRITLFCRFFRGFDM